MKHCDIDDANHDPDTHRRSCHDLNFSLRPFVYPAIPSHNEIYSCEYDSQPDKMPHPKHSESNATLQSRLIGKKFIQMKTLHLYCLPQKTYSSIILSLCNINILVFLIDLLLVSPDFLCDLFHKLQFCPLLFLGQLVSDLTGSKSTLRT